MVLAKKDVQRFKASTKFAKKQRIMRKIMINKGATTGMFSIKFRKRKFFENEELPP